MPDVPTPAPSPVSADSPAIVGSNAPAARETPEPALPRKLGLLEIPPAPGPRPSGRAAKSWRDYEWGSASKLITVHILGIGGAIAGLIYGAPASAWICALVLYVTRMFFVTAAYHRYFAHRTYKMGRVMQFLFALGATSTGQMGVLWWAAHHRDHHRHSDTDRDVHSPVQFGFWHSHIMWIYDNNGAYDHSKIKDFLRFPELVVLDRLWIVPPIVLGTLTYLALGGWGLFIGFFFSTVLVWHATFTINSLSHVWGKRRYVTTDDSRNNWFLAMISLGEGWHNNHHHFMNSCRQGFFWWEVDVTYMVLRGMQALGLVSDIKEPHKRIYEAGPAQQPGAELLPSKQTATS